MTENIEKTLLMKCEVCGYKEEVSLKSLETIKTPCDTKKISKEEYLWLQIVRY